MIQIPRETPVSKMIFNTLLCHIMTNLLMNSLMKEQSLFSIKRINNIIIFQLELSVEDIAALSGNLARGNTLKREARYRGRDLLKGIEQMLDLFNWLDIQVRAKHMLDLYSIRCRHIIFHLEDCKLMAFTTKVASF
jgi:hypothetical protein